VEKLIGIYEIKNTLNGHRYIGSSVDILKRWKAHRYSLDRGDHHSRYLQNAWGKYGEKHFKFSILEECEPIRDTILFIEQKYLDLKPEYNMCKTAGNTLGTTLSKEAKIKIGEANSKRIWSNESRHKMAVSCKNAKHNKDKSVRVGMYIKDALVREFKSISDAARYLGNINKRTNIRRALQGRQKSAYGYSWKRYKHDIKNNVA